MTANEVVEFFRREVARARFVARDWRYFSDLELKSLSISFTFMCPCENDVTERFVVPHPEANQFRDYDGVVRHTLSLVLRELEEHLSDEAGIAPPPAPDEFARVPPESWRLNSR